MSLEILVTASLGISWHLPIDKGSPILPEARAPDSTGGDE